MQEPQASEAMISGLPATKQWKLTKHWTVHGLQEEPRIEMAGYMSC